jgi:hypothetical protein
MVNFLTPSRIPGCRCSEYQLDQVGCECQLVRVAVWPRGYADDAGLQIMSITEHANPHTEAARRFGPMARVHRVQRDQPAPVPPVSPAAAAAYTRHDNT